MQMKLTEKHCASVVFNTQNEGVRNFYWKGSFLKKL